MLKKPVMIVVITGFLTINLRTTHGDVLKQT